MNVTITRQTFARRGAEMTYRVKPEGFCSFAVSKIAYESTNPNSGMYTPKWVIDLPMYKHIVFNTRKEAIAYRTTQYGTR